MISGRIIHCYRSEEKANYITNCGNVPELESEQRAVGGRDTQIALSFCLRFTCFTREFRPRLVRRCGFLRNLGMEFSVQAADIFHYREVYAAAAQGLETCA